MSCNVVQNCAKKRTCENWCFLSSNCKGWGCKYIRIAPDIIPTTELERGKLFSKVYSEAEHLSILECPHYRSKIIDEVVESPVELLKIVKLLSESKPVSQ